VCEVRVTSDWLQICWKKRICESSHDRGVSKTHAQVCSDPQTNAVRSTNKQIVIYSCALECICTSNLFVNPSVCICESLCLHLWLSLCASSIIDWSEPINKGSDWTMTFFNECDQILEQGSVCGCFQMFLHRYLSCTELRKSNNLLRVRQTFYTRCRSVLAAGDRESDESGSDLGWPLVNCSRSWKQCPILSFWLQKNKCDQRCQMRLVSVQSGNIGLLFNLLGGGKKQFAFLSCNWIWETSLSKVLSKKINIYIYIYIHRLYYIFGYEVLYAYEVCHGFAQVAGQGYDLLFFNWASLIRQQWWRLCSANNKAISHIAPSSSWNNPTSQYSINHMAGRISFG